MWVLLAGPGGSRAGLCPCLTLSLLSGLLPGAVEAAWTSEEPLGDLGSGGCGRSHPTFLNTLLPGSKPGIHKVTFST